MDLCECVVPVGRGGTLNVRRSANPLDRLIKGEERWKTPDHQPRDVLPQNWGGTEPNRTVTCNVAQSYGKYYHLISQKLKIHPF
ncbi:uncharacterized protein TNCV_1430921 [Trichonephila clavipes]|nr:uncharacterized protein TNCV_1430921 [Trichonephila clavipes]